MDAFDKSPFYLNNRCLNTASKVSPSIFKRTFRKGARSSRGKKPFLVFHTQDSDRFADKVKNLNLCLK